MNIISIHTVQQNFTHINLFLSVCTACIRRGKGRWGSGIGVPLVWIPAWCRQLVAWGLQVKKRPPCKVLRISLLIAAKLAKECSRIGAERGWRAQGRKRFEAKSKARRGQVQEPRAPTASYGGEPTGIKARVAKSRRFG